MIKMKDIFTRQNVCKWFKKAFTRRNGVIVLKHVPLGLLLFCYLLVVHMGIEYYLNPQYCACQQHLLPSDLERLVPVISFTVLTVFLICTSIMVYSVSLLGATFVLSALILFNIAF